MTEPITYRWLGWADSAPALELPHETFAYAGKFRLPYTGKAVAREQTETLVGAAAFDEDRGVADALRIRYITVRESHRGQRIGPKLAALVISRAQTRGYTRVRVAVNNPAAYEAMYRAGLGYTGERRNLGELVLETEQGLTDEDYKTGLEEFAERSCPDQHRRIINRGQKRGQPDRVDPPSETR